MTTELQQMRRLRGQDFYRADPSFATLLDQVADPAQHSQLEERVRAFAAKVSNEWDALAESAALDYAGPWIQSYDNFGNPIDQVCLPPPVQQLRREVVQAGIFENASRVEQYAKVYLLAHLGETGVVCPLACTEGFIRAIEAVGSAFLKDHYLKALRSAETPLAGAQFITEQDMGSDVGALTTRAEAVGEGEWRLYGEKWFCSAIDEYFLIAARPEGAPEGTAGVGIFLVPRMLEGQLNRLRIKRLKDKIGTQELPTAEIELEGALGYNIGPVDQGFKTLMNNVINTSRVMNAASALGCTARAWLEAKNYAEQRSAFGSRIIQYPMVQESLNRIGSILKARRAVYFKMLKRMDQNPLEDLGSDEAYWQRFLINLCKYRTAIGATECTREAILQLGGNGTIESFSILPRLYRDSLVMETWEGTHNTLALQIARDAGRFPFKAALQQEIAALVEEIQDPEAAGWLREQWQQSEPYVERLQDEVWASQHARHALDRIAALLEFGALATSPSTTLLATYRHEVEPSLRPIPLQ